MRAATAIELVHMATLVHDDVLDDGAAAPRPPDRRRHLRPRPRARRPATCSSPAPSRCSPSAGDARAIALLADASVALARGELAQRHDAFDTAISEQRYLERCRLKTATLFECACLLGRDEERARRLRRRDRPRLPAPRRRARRLRAAGADRQGARHRPARRHRHPAADRRRRADPADRARPTCARSTPPRPTALCDRIAATGALEQVRSRALEMVADGQGAGSTRPRFDAEQRAAARPRRRRRRPALQLARKSSAVIRSASSAAVKVSATRCMFSCSSVFELVAQRPGAEVELLVEGVDLDSRRGPRRSATRTRGSAARGASGRGRRPAPSRSAAPAPSRTPGRRGVRRSVFVWLCGSRRLMLCTIEPAKRRLNPHFSVKIRRKPQYRVGARPQFACDPIGSGGRYHGSDAETSDPSSSRSS